MSTANTLVDSVSISNIEFCIQQVSVVEPLVIQHLFEYLVDGILLFTPDGICLTANRQALRICKQLTDTAQISEGGLPSEVHDLCNALIDYQATQNSTQNIVFYSEVKLSRLWVRIRAQWFARKNYPTRIVVILEDQLETLTQKALLEAKQYDLTPRETDIWQLKWLDYTMQDIAQELHISINTVKRHFQNIYTKLQP